MMSDLSDATWKFAMDMFNVLCKSSPNENVFLSPLSIMAALSMTMAGARGGTEAELKKALHLDVVKAKPLHDKVGAMMAALTKGGCTTLANRLFTEKTFALMADFQALVAKSYAAEVGQVDFLHRASHAAAEINAWVEKNTGGHIKDLISPTAVDERTRLVLVNAIHFKGLWESPFEKAETRDLTFHVKPGKEIPMPLMSKSNETFPYSFSDDMKCHCVRMPFRSEDLAFYIVVPEERFGLAAAEAKIATNPGHLRELISNCMDAELSLLLVPRFTISSQFNLESQLPALGIKALFEPTACDLSGLAGERLHASKVVHKAFLEVTEEGAEAAAATGMVFTAFCMPLNVPSVVADHPFLVVLTSGESPLFIGRIAVPEAKK